MARFLLTRPLPPPAIDLLSEAGTVTVLTTPPDAHILSDLCASADFDVVLTQLTDHLDAELIARAKISGVSNYAAGVDNIDIDAATRRHILVANTPDALTEATADIALLLMLATARRCLEADAILRAGRFQGWEPDFLIGTDVSGAQLGLAGMGRIAKATARRALGFGMHVQFALPESHHRALQPTELGDLADRITQVGWRTLLESNDFVSIHLPLTEQTYHLFGAEAFAQMRASAILINTARGALVDEAALVRALQSRQIAGAGLDVYEYEPEVSSDLRALPQTTLLPHIGSATRSVRSEMARLCALNAVRMAAGDLPLHAINPQAWNRD